MGLGFKPTNSAELEQERKLRSLIKASQTTGTDRTKFEELCAKFRATCAEIGTVIGRQMFLGSYDEIESIMDDESIQANVKFQGLYNKLNVLNSACKHEGEKLGYRLAEWWTYCWRNELAQLAQNLLSHSLSL